MSQNTMLAGVYTPGNSHLTLTYKAPVPTPKEGEVLLKIAACGVCHSDVFILTEYLQDPRNYIMGHEAVGTIVALGPHVDASKVEVGTGKLYAVYAISPCARVVMPIDDGFGLGLNGGYAEYTVVQASQLVPVPDGIPAPLAAVMADAGVTAYKAVFNNVKRGDRVLIIGAGGLGHLAVQFAKHIGATVFAVDMRPEARKLAEKLGAKAYDTQTLMTLTSASGSSPGGATGGNQFTVDVVIDFVADVGTINLGYAATKDNSAFFNKGSKIVLVGVSLVDLPIQSAFFVSNEVSVIASCYGTKEHMAAGLELVAQGIVKPHVEVEPLEKLNDVLIDLRGGKYIGRKVVVPRSTTTKG